MNIKKKQNLMEITVITFDAYLMNNDSIIETCKDVEKMKIFNIENFTIYFEDDTRKTINCIEEAKILSKNKNIEKLCINTKDDVILSLYKKDNGFNIAYHQNVNMKERINKLKTLKIKNYKF